MRHTIPALALLIAIPIAASLLLACGDDNGYGDATPTGPDTTATATALATGEEPTLPPGTDATPGENELGEAPIFWRTLDKFESLAAGEEYKIVFRVTNGYAEDTLPIEATAATGTASVTFEAARTTPEGEEDKGTFYSVNIVLPEEGSWQLTARAGAAEVTVDVEVAPGGTPAG